MATRKSSLAKARSDAAKEFVSLAKSYDPAKHDVFNGFWLVSEKFDGIRGRMDARGYLLSRSQHKLLGVPEEVRAQIEEAAKGLMLDGEIWAGRGVEQFRFVSGAARTNKTTVETWRRSCLKFVVFDYVSDEPYFDRYRRLRDLELNDWPFLQLAEQHTLYSQGELETRKLDAERKGAEGLILRDSREPYFYGRKEHLLKVVTRMRAEFAVYGHEPGEGKHEGRMGAVICYHGGERFKVGSGFTDEQRASYQPPIGTRITIEFKGWTSEAGGRSVPREPVYIAEREDGV